MTKKTRRRIKFEKCKKITARHLVEAKIKSKNDQLYISIVKLRRELGKLQEKNIRRDVYDIFKDEVPFFHVITVGDNLTKKLSLIRLDQGNLPQIIDLMEAQEEGVIFSIQYEGMIQEEIESLPRIPVDCRSLDNYIYSTRSQLKNPKHSEVMLSAMQRYLSEAEKLQKLLNELESRGITGLPYVQERNQFGRYYHKRINLQSMPKVVRQAALGKCYEYDLNSAIVSVKLLLTNQLVKDSGGDYSKLHWHSKEFLLEKNKVIQRLAGLLSVNHPDKPKLIKQLVTALSSGASLSERGWSTEAGYKFGSFSDIIKNPDDRQALMDDGWLKAFSKEQNEQNEIITKNLIDVARKWIIDEGRLKTDNGKIRNNVVMVLIYQHLETNLMERVIEEFGDKIILHVHDAVYTSKPLNREKLEGVVEGFLSEFKIRPTESFMDLRFSKTDHTFYSKNSFVPEMKSESKKEIESDFDKLSNSMIMALDRSSMKNGLGSRNGLGVRIQF